MKRAHWIAAVAIAGATTWATLSSAPAAESCHTWATELVNEGRDCVSSVLAPRGSVTYGPRHLTDESGAWCEGVEGDGIGETITLWLDPAKRFRTIRLVNGYARSRAAFSNNNRVRAFAVKTSDGVEATVAVADHANEQYIKLPRVARANWVRLSIAAVYRGEKFSDTCLSRLLVDIEEYSER